jgi:hypothetical protein
MLNEGDGVVHGLKSLRMLLYTAVFLGFNIPLLLIFPLVASDEWGARQFGRDFHKALARPLWAPSS